RSDRDWSSDVCSSDLHCACDNHQVGLTRRWTKNFAAKTRDIVPRGRCRDHLNRATSESELERPDRVFASPVVKLLHRSYPDPLLLQFATQAFVDSFAHRSTLTPRCFKRFIVPIANTLYSKPKRALQSGATEKPISR